jgi:acyl carrier protein
LNESGPCLDHRQLDFQPTNTGSERNLYHQRCPNVIAKHLGVDVKIVTDETHLTYDLGADWLDQLELMIAIEDEFAGVEITDDDVEQIDVVGDLIRHIEDASSERRRLLGELQ